MKCKFIRENDAPIIEQPSFTIRASRIKKFKSKVKSNRPYDQVISDTEPYSKCNLIKPEIFLRFPHISGIRPLSYPSRARFLDAPEKTLYPCQERSRRLPLPLLPLRQRRGVHANLFSGLLLRQPRLVRWRTNCSGRVLAAGSGL